MFKNGHYIDSGLSQDYRDKIDREAQAENESLTSWDDVPDENEDNNTD